jgi:amino acid transporter
MDVTTRTDSSPNGLRRELSVWEAIGVSVALMAPSMAVNINPQGSAGLVGRAVPLTFVLGTVAVLLIAYTFVRLSQRFSHSGSVYGFVGATLGPRAGAFAGWALVGTYLFFGVVTTVAAGIFSTTLLRTVGGWAEEPGWLAFVFAGVYALVVVGIASRPARGGTRLLLVFECVTVGLIVVVIAVVLVRLLNGSAPGGQSFDLSVFQVEPGTDPSALFLGVVFALLSFAGFEAAATLGEEARDPRKDIPRAIIGTAVFGGIFFVVVTAVEVMGFGTGTEGIETFIASGSLVGDLAATYVSPAVGTLITVGAAVSAFGCALACIVGGSRLVFALSRDGLGPAALGKVSLSTGIPFRAALAGVGFVVLIVAVASLGLRAEPSHLFVISGTTGTLILLFAYGLATIGAVKLLFFPRDGVFGVRRWEIVVPLAALAVLAYTLFRNLIPLPEGPAEWGPLLAVAWLALNLAIVLVRRRPAERAGRLLMESDGIRHDMPR